MNWFLKAVISCQLVFHIQDTLNWNLSCLSFLLYIFTGWVADLTRKLTQQGFLSYFPYLDISTFSEKSKRWNWFKTSPNWFLINSWKPPILNHSPIVTIHLSTCINFPPVIIPCFIKALVSFWVKPHISSVQVKNISHTVQHPYAV